MSEASKLLDGLDYLDRVFSDHWFRGNECQLSKAAARFDGYEGRETTPLQAELCKTLGKPEDYRWLMDWTGKETTNLADVKKLIADTRARLQSTNV